MRFHTLNKFNTIGKFVETPKCVHGFGVGICNSMECADKIVVHYGGGNDSLSGRKEFSSVGQKKSHSFLESIINVAVGFIISFIANMVVLPWFGMKVSVSNALWIGVIFTVISIVRSYLLRRLFNRIMIRKG